jgi:hypothetical protein
VDSLAMGLVRRDCAVDRLAERNSEGPDRVKDGAKRRRAAAVRQGRTVLDPARTSETDAIQAIDGKL